MTRSQIQRKNVFSLLLWTPSGKYLLNSADEEYLVISSSIGESAVSVLSRNQLLGLIVAAERFRLCGG